MSAIVLPALFDAHVHLRQGDLLQTVARHHNYCERLVVMPNTKPPICSPSEIQQYRSACRTVLGTATEPLLTIMLTPRTTPADVRRAKDVGVVGAKLYPEGVTTQSGDGIGLDTLTALRDYRPDTDPYPHSLHDFAEVITELERQDLVLLIHAELPGAECLQREAAFVPLVKRIVSLWPQLRVTVEHVSSAVMIETIRSLASGGARLAGTITAQHLLCTTDDILIGSDKVGQQGGKLRPDNHCLPVPKSRSDRQRLRIAATSGEPYFFLGSDSAPHPPGSKYSACGCAGVWSAPVLVPSLVEVFEDMSQIGRLPGFLHDRGCVFYGLAGTGREILVEEEPWRVPDTIDGLVPFRAGEILRWRLS